MVQRHFHSRSGAAVKMEAPEMVMKNMLSLNDPEGFTERNEAHGAASMAVENVDALAAHVLSKCQQLQQIPSC